MKLTNQQKQMLMYLVAFVAGYLMCMYYPIHNRNNVPFPVLEGNTNRNNGSHNHPSLLDHNHPSLLEKIKSVEKDVQALQDSVDTEEGVTGNRNPR